MEDHTKWSDERLDDLRQSVDKLTDATQEVGELRSEISHLQTTVNHISDAVHEENRPMTRMEKFTAVSILVAFAGVLVALFT